MAGPAFAFTQVLSNQNASDAQARSLKQEAFTAEKNSAQAVKNAEFEAEAHVIQARKLFGEQTAGYAASGVSGGSVFSVMAESAVNAELDRLSILFNGDLRSKNFQAEANAKNYAAKGIEDSKLLDAIGVGAKSYTGYASASKVAT